MGDRLPVPSRASDAERELAASIINEGVATGRLSPEEHEARLDAVYRARYATELVSLTADLPAVHDLGALARRPVSQRVDATVSKVSTQVAGGPGVHVHARSRFGRLSLDLRQLQGGTEPVVVTADSFFGQIRILLPAGAQVVDAGTSRVGHRVVPAGPHGAAGPGGPVIYLNGRTLFGQLKCLRSDRFWQAWRR